MIDVNKDFYDYFFDPKYAKQFSKEVAYGDAKDKDDEVTTELLNLFFNLTKNK